MKNNFLCQSSILIEEFLIENVQTILEEQNYLKYSLRPEEIKHILMRNPAYLNNIDYAIEFLIRSSECFLDDAETSSLLSNSKISLKSLRQMLSKCYYLAENRIIRIDDYEDNSFSVKKFMYNSDAIVFSYSILIMIIRSEFDNDNPIYTNLHQLIRLFNKYSIQSNFSPISPNSIKKIDQKIDTELTIFAGIPSGSSNIFQRGIVSNGHFIFVLHSDFYLSIFPISIENGGFLSPMMCKLNIDSNSEAASLSFISEKLIVTTPNNHYGFNITSLITSQTESAEMTEIQTKDQRLNKKSSILVTDGVVNVVIKKEKDFCKATVKTIDSNRKLSKVELHKSRNEKMYETYPFNDSMNLLSCPSETNGIVLSFYIKVDSSHILVRQFSLIDGCHLKDDLIETNINIAAITYDSINQMHYVVIDNNGQLIVYALTGQSSCSVNPFLFGFSISDLEHEFLLKPKKFTIFSKGLQNNDLMKDEREFTYLLSSVLLSSVFFKKDINTFLFEEKESILVLPIFIIELAESLNDEKNKEKDKDKEIVMNYIKLTTLQIYSALFVINIRHQFLNESNEDDEDDKMLRIRFQTIVFEMLSKLSKIKESYSMSVISFIFLQLFDLIDLPSNNDNYQAILEGLLISSSPTLFKYIIHVLINNSIQMLFIFSFTNNVFNKYIVNNFSLSKVHPNIISFLLCHQRCIINQLNISLKKEHFSAASLIININYNDCKTDNEALNIFAEYTNFLVNQFSSSIANSSSFKEIRKTTVYFLFSNYLSLIAGLYKYHEVAQIVTPLLHITQNSLKDFFVQKKIILSDNDEAQKILENISLVFGAFTGTLIKGGNYSLFDEKYKWLIRPNMNLIEHPNQLYELDNPTSNVDSYIDENVRQFLSPQSENFNGKEIIQNVYKKWNFNMNKNLKQPLIDLDQLFLAVELYHLNLFDELKEMNINKLRPALQQMMRVRNAARSILRSNNSIRQVQILSENNESTTVSSESKHKKSDLNELNSYYSPFDLIVIKCKMLLRLKSKFDHSNFSIASKLLADFVLSSDQPNTLINYISNQRNRLQLTNIGFSLIEDSYSLRIDEFFIQIIDATLSIAVDNFDGLSAIIQYDNLHKSEKYISNFLLKALKNFEYPYLSLIAYKLIKSEVLSKEAIGKAIESFIPYSINDNKLFGLFYKKLGYVENILTNSEYFQFFDSETEKKVPLISLKLVDYNKISSNQWYIISEVFSIQTVNSELYQNILRFFLKTNFSSKLKNLNTLHYISLCIYSFYQNCEDSYSPKNDFLLLLKSLGKSLNSNDDLERANEIVSILRQILNGSNKPSEILNELINSYGKDISNTVEFYEIICAIFAVLGGFVDIIQRDCFVSFRLNRENIRKGILIDKNKVLEIPINEESKPIEINDYNVYPESLYPFNCSMFRNYQFIKRYLKFSLSDFTKKISLIYLNSLSFYLKEENFVKLLTEEEVNYLIHNLSCLMNPFDTMKDIQKVISSLLSIKKIECLKDCKFSVMSNKSLECSTYLSPVLKPTKIKVVIETENIFEGYFGLIADCPLDAQFPYVIIHSKLGIIYPCSISQTVQQIEPIKDANFTFTVDSSNQMIYLHEIENSIKIQIPYVDNKTYKFRIYICLFNSCDIKAIKVTSPDSNDQIDDCFQLDYVPLPCPIYEPTKMDQLIKYPNSINQFTEDQLKDFSKPEKLITFSPLTNLTFYDKPLHEMVNINSLIFNFKQAESISIDFINSIISHVYSKLITQVSTLIMMELVNDGFGGLLFKFNPSYLIKLFSYLQIPLEFYDHEKIRNNEFPFNINESILKENSLTSHNQQFNNLDFEMKKCLYSITRINQQQKESSDDFNDALKKYIENMFNDPSIHTLRNHNLSAKYYDLSYAKSFIMLTVPESAESIIVSIPHLSDTRIDHVEKYNPKNDETISFPFIFDAEFGKSTNVMIKIENQIKHYYKGLCILSVNKYNNHWVFNTSYELLLLLKEYYLNSKEPVFFRKILIELILINSPYVSMFVSKLLIRFGQDCFFSPSQFSLDYLKDLYLLCSLIKEHPNLVDKNIISFINHENKSLHFPILSKLAPFFPEFNNNHIVFSKKPNPDLKIQIKLDLLNIPKRIDSPLDDLMTCLSIIDEKVTIQSHYFDILIIWLSISLFYLDDNIISNEKDGIFEIKNNKEFNCEFYPHLIHDSFLKDIEMIKVEWTKEKIYEFVSSIPSYALKNTNFKQLCEFVLSDGCEYNNSTSSPRVLLIVSYVIHRVNHLYEKYTSSIPTENMNIINYLLSLKEIGQVFLDQVIKIESPTVQFRLNRFEAHRISIEMNGNQSMSIIGQVSESLSKHSTIFRQSESLPWTVKFINEKALDCGGPGRELFSIISSSIIEETTGLFILSPNGRNKCGSSNREVYVPFHSQPSNKQLIEMKLQERIDCYRSIGVFIGIVIRIGFYQDLPFAPIVWKAIAGEQINENDIFSIDQRFSDFIQNLRNAKNNEELFNSLPQPNLWNCENWDGTVVNVNNPTDSNFVLRENIDIFVTNCIKKRIDLLLENTCHIRLAFCENIGFYNHVFMSGHLLSFLAQGSSQIKTSDLKRIFFLVSPLTDSYNYFLEAIEMMNDKQRSLLLKFVTGLTKLPKNDGNFFIRVELKNDSKDYLPMASTCFNILYLPIYSSPQIAFNMLKIAIESCQTIEMY